MRFERETFKQLWQILDVTDRAELLVSICGLNKVQRLSIIYTFQNEDKLKNLYKVIEKLQKDEKHYFNDEKQFERFRDAVLNKRILPVLNSKKYNTTYSEILKFKPKK